MRAPRSVTILVAAGAATAALAGCHSNPPAAAASSAPATVSATVSTTAPTQPSASGGSASAVATPTPSSPVATVTEKAAGCATAAGYGLPDSSITVCPDAGPVGSVVHVTIKGCAPGAPAAGLNFLGPNSWLGTNGGGGANVPYSPRTGSVATATFTIPATYTGGNENGPYPTLAVKPGTGYAFITNPAGSCNIPFTVTAP